MNTAPDRFVDEVLTFVRESNQRSHNRSPIPFIFRRLLDVKNC